MSGGDSQALKPSSQPSSPKGPANAEVNKPQEVKVHIAHPSHETMSLIVHAASDNINSILLYNVFKTS